VLDRSLSVICITFTSIPEFASGSFPRHALRDRGPSSRAPVRSTPTAEAAGRSLRRWFCRSPCSCCMTSGYVARMIRVSMIGVMEKPYIRTAILKA